MNPLVFIDAHVHLYTCHNLAACLDYAQANIERCGVAGSTGVLLLAETADENRFDALVSLADRREPVGRWCIGRTGEAESLIARSASDDTLIVIAGRQIATSERLEALALGTTLRFEDGVPIDRAIAAAQTSGALVVLPYGVGKWWGRRGRIIESLLQSNGESVLFLGDNGNRLAHMPMPKLLRRAMERGRIVLPGSGPLPLPGQERRIASYGMMLPLQLDLLAPLRQLRATLIALDASPRCVGVLSDPMTFMRAQIAMQLWNRRP